MNPQIQQLIGQAIERFQSGSPKQAEELLLRVLNMQSNNLPALEILGLIKASLGEHLEAAKLLKKAIKLNPQNPATQYNLAKALSESKDYVGSLIHHEKALQLAPNNPDGWLNYGQTLVQLKRYEQALSAFNKALAINPQYAEAWYNKALGCVQLERHEEAVNYFNKSIELLPNNPKTWLELSNSLGILQRYQDAVQCCEQALKLQPNYPEAWLNKGSAYTELKQFSQAIDCYDKALVLKNDFVAAWYSKGVALEKLDQKQEALTCHDKAIELDPSLAKAWLNKGSILNYQAQYQEALACFERTLELQPDYADAWANKGVALYELLELDEAIRCCNRAIEIDPKNSKAWLKKGSILNNLTKYQEALACFDRALELQPDYADAWANKGMSLGLQLLLDEAIKCCNRAIELDSSHVDAWHNKGGIFFKSDRYQEAINCYEKVLDFDSDRKFLRGLLAFLKNHIGEWKEWNKTITLIKESINNNGEITPPFPALSILEEPIDQLRAAQIFSNAECPQNTILGPIPKFQNPKIKIAYFSADFRDHAVAYLTAELFELHDRNQFEIYGFSLKRANNSPTRDRLIAGFDHFIEVEGKTDQEIAQLARSLKIDIAIDLGGHTQDARTGVFAYRAAPMQVNYLGFAGTMGANYIDYMIADQIVIPQEYKDFYLEKKVYLPNSYMVDDSKRVPANKVFSRSEFGLPEKSVVFCCFNNAYKFNPPRIASFAKILASTPNSVLWVSENNPSFRQNLLAEFEKLEISEGRIIFAGRVDALEDHLARYRLADLFLDTNPYNAHTTALDSLKAGVPVISMAGKTFASRVGASLLTAIGLPELIVHSEEEFVDLACQLGGDPKALQLLKDRLISNYQTMPLFNAKLFCGHLESAYQEMWRCHMNDLPASDIYIAQ